MSVWCTPTRLATSLSVTPYSPCFENRSSAASRICSVISARCSALVGRLPRALADLFLVARLRRGFTSRGTGLSIVLSRRAEPRRPGTLDSASAVFCSDAHFGGKRWVSGHLFAESHGDCRFHVQRGGVEHGEVGPVRLRHQQEDFGATQDQSLRASRSQPIDDLQIH